MMERPITTLLGHCLAMLMMTGSTRSKSYVVKMHPKSARALYFEFPNLLTAEYFPGLGYRVETSFGTCHITSPSDAVGIEIIPE